MIWRSDPSPLHERAQSPESMSNIPTYIGRGIRTLNAWTRSGYIAHEQPHRVAWLIPLQPLKSALKLPFGAADADNRYYTHVGAACGPNLADRRAGGPW